MIPRRLSVQEYASILRQCARTKSAEHGKRIHIEILENGYGGNTFLYNCLIYMYGSCDHLHDARYVFESTSRRNVYTWTILLAAYAQGGHLQEARSIFNKSPSRNTTTWNSLVSAYAQNGHPGDGIGLYYTMCLQGEPPDAFTFVGLIDSCATLQCLSLGTSLHERVAEAGLVHEVTVCNTLINMYGKCSEVHRSWEIFKQMHNPDVVSWTSMVTAFAQNGHLDSALGLFYEMPMEKSIVSWTAIVTAAVQSGKGELAFELLRRMTLEGAMPSSLIFISVVEGCKSVATGRELFKAVDGRPVALFNSLMSMFTRCGSLGDAKNVFEKTPQRDTITWNSMVTAYACNENIASAERVYKKMPHRDEVSYHAMLSAYARVGHTEALEHFRRMSSLGVAPSARALVSLLESCRTVGEVDGAVGSLSVRDPSVANAAIDAYGRCGAVDRAKDVFVRSSGLDSSSWGRIIACCVQNGDARSAIHLFRMMDLEGTQAGSLAYVSAVAACTESNDLARGREIHASMHRTQLDTPMCNALIDMYGKFGMLEECLALFGRQEYSRSVVSWTALISACANSGDAYRAFDIFRKMTLDGIPPNRVTMTAVLSASVHFGLLEPGMEWFRSMSTDYDILPTEDHYKCIVDLFRRAGKLHEAGQLVHCLVLI